MGIENLHQIKSKEEETCFFFKLFLILIAIFTLGVLIVKFCKSCSVKQATAICKDSVKNFFRELLAALFEDAPVQERFYPVLVGWDGCRVLPQLVDSEFSTIREDFASCYCTNIVLTEDNAFVIYQFSIMRKPGGLDDDTLGQLVQKQAEEILANTMRFYDCYIPAEPLTLTELFPHVLNVAFARNDAGIKVLDEQKRKMQKLKALSERPGNPPMREKWEGNDGK